MKLYEFCFSPTGGSLKVSEILSRAWDCEKVFVDLTRQEGSYPVPGKEDVCIVTAPSYSGRVPAPEAERLQKLSGNGAAAVLVTVYGNRAFEDTLIEMKDLLMQAGFHCAAAVAAIAEAVRMHRMKPNWKILAARSAACWKKDVGQRVCRFQETIHIVKRMLLRSNRQQTKAVSAAALVPRSARRGRFAKKIPHKPIQSAVLPVCAV